MKSLAHGVRLILTGMLLEMALIYRLAEDRKVAVPWEIDAMFIFIGDYDIAAGIVMWVIDAYGPELAQANQPSVRLPRSRKA